LELSFDTKSLRQLCENRARAGKVLGRDIANKLVSRLADLRAVTCVNDLVVGHPREIDDSGDKHYVVDLCNGVSITFCANHVTNSFRNCSKIDWSRVTRIKLLKIGSAHG